MTYSQIAGALATSSSRLGIETTIWCPILLVASLVVFVFAIVHLRRTTAFPKHPREH